MLLQDSLLRDLLRCKAKQPAGIVPPCTQELQLQANSSLLWLL